MWRTRYSGIEAARAKLGDLANSARYAGQVTWLTRNGRTVAAVTPATVAFLGMSSVPGPASIWDLYVVRGEQDAAGDRLDATGLEMSAELAAWAASHGVGADPDVWVLVTPVGDSPGEMRSLIASRRTVTAPQPGGPLQALDSILTPTPVFDAEPHTPDSAPASLADGCKVELDLTGEEVARLCAAVQEIAVQERRAAELDNRSATPHLRHADELDILESRIYQAWVAAFRTAHGQDPDQPGPPMPGGGPDQ